MPDPNQIIAPVNIPAPVVIVAPVVMGSRGPKGDKGDPGADSTVPGPPGDDGEKGDKGDKGDDGVTQDISGLMPKSGGAFTGPVSMASQLLDLANGAITGANIAWTFSGSSGPNLWTAMGGGGTVGNPSVVSLTASGTVTAAGVINTRYNIGVGSTLTLAITDNGGTRECGHAVGTVITVPLQSSVAWPSNSIIRIRRGTAAGPVTFAGGVTIQNSDSAPLVYPGGSFDLIRVSSDVWRIANAQTTYIPGGNFTGTMIVGDGGQKLSYISGSDGGYNTFLGIGSGRSNTTGANNSAQGFNALYSNTTGANNSAQGLQALRSNSTGSNNSTQGAYALYSNTTGGNNSAQGYQTLYYNTTGSNNATVGYRAGFGVSGSSDITGNSLFGFQSGFGLLTGANYNTIFGYSAGSNLTTGARNIIIGYNAQATSNTGNDQLNIGGAIKGDLATGNIAITGSITSPSVIATADPAGDTSVITRNYSTAKGPNLIANGSGGMGSNYNFPNFTFDPADVAVGKGSFKSNIYNATAYSAEYIPIDNQRSYVLSGYGKSGNRDGSEYNPASIQYLGVALYDADYVAILTQSILQWPGSVLTTLAAPLNPGDTTVTLTDATGWNNGSSHLGRHFAWWPFTNSLGYTWDNYTYSGPNITRKSGSPYLSAGTWAAGGISGNVITLSAPWPFAALPAGTPVRNSDEGATFKYIAAGGVAVPTTWTKYEGVLGPVDPTGRDGYRSWIGAAYMKILFLTNYTASGNVIRWSGLNLRAMDRVPSKTVSQLSSIPPEAGMQYFCTNASGGASMVFGDGTNWRKPTTSILT